MWGSGAARVRVNTPFSHGLLRSGATGDARVRLVGVGAAVVYGLPGSERGPVVRRSGRWPLLHGPSGSGPADPPPRIGRPGGRSGPEPSLRRGSGMKGRRGPERPVRCSRPGDEAAGLLEDPVAPFVAAPGAEPFGYGVGFVGEAADHARARAVVAFDAVLGRQVRVGADGLAVDREDRRAAVEVAEPVLMVRFVVGGLKFRLSHRRTSPSRGRLHWGGCRSGARCRRL
jgi:hypothetical protein